MISRLETKQCSSPKLFPLKCREACNVFSAGKGVADWKIIQQPKEPGYVLDYED